jgi:hypothetical protein
VRRQVAHGHLGGGLRGGLALHVELTHVHRRAVRRQTLAERQHPLVIQVEVLAAGERPERDGVLDIRRERGVAPLARLEPRPLRRGDHLARLDRHLGERQPLLGALGRDLRQRPPDAVLQRPEALYRELPVGGARQGQDRLAHVDVAGKRGTPARGARPDAASPAAQLVDLLLRLPGDPLGADPGPLHEGPSAVIRACTAA